VRQKRSFCRTHGGTSREDIVDKDDVLIGYEVCVADAEDVRNIFLTRFFP
jgi:hypothetical protein